MTYTGAKAGPGSGPARCGGIKVPQLGLSAMNIKRVARAVALMVACGLALVSCSSDGGGSAVGGGGTTPGGTTSEGSEPGAIGGGSAEYATGTSIPLPLAPAEIIFMHNGTQEPQRSYWQQVAADFEAQHPGVTVTVMPMATDDLRNDALPTAFETGTAPDLFQSWGGGQLVEWVNQGATRNLTEVLAPTIAELNPAEITNWQLDGQTFGLPYAIGPGGFWVNLNLLDQAGLVDNATTDAHGNVTGGTVQWPSTLEGLFDMWATLKEHNITPVAVGGGSGWAGPWWYYGLVSQMCSPDAITSASTQRDFTDPCWEEAASQLKQIVGKDVFNSEWGTTADQGGADSSAGLVVTGQAAMEYQGPWAGTVMANIFQSEPGNAGQSPEFLAWYPFPSVDSGGTGTVMAAGDGFSVLDPAMGSQARSDAAAALLAYLLSQSVQEQGLNFNYGGNNVVALPGIPTNQAAAAQISDPVLAKQAQTLAAATHTIPWLDVSLGSTVGSAMNDAVNSLMRGQISPDAVISSINAAAGNL